MTPIQRGFHPYIHRITENSRNFLNFSTNTECGKEQIEYSYFELEKVFGARKASFINRLNYWLNKCGRTIDDLSGKWIYIEVIAVSKSFFGFANRHIHLVILSFLRGYFYLLLGGNDWFTFLSKIFFKRMLSSFHFFFSMIISFSFSLFILLFFLFLFFLFFILQRYINIGINLIFFNHFLGKLVYKDYYVINNNQEMVK